MRRLTRSEYLAAADTLSQLGQVAHGGRIYACGRTVRWALVSAILTPEQAAASAMAWWLLSTETGGQLLVSQHAGRYHLTLGVAWEGRDGEEEREEVQPCAA